MEPKERDILLILILVALLFIVFNCLTGKAGNLEPSGPPEPTMVTLNELNTKIEELSSPVNKIVRGVITFAEEPNVATQTFSPAVDPNRSVVLLSDAVTFNQDTTPDDDWLSRSGACLIDLSDTQITVQVEEHPAKQKVSYQIIEYK